MLSRNETADSDARIYDTKGLIIIIIPLSSRYRLHASDLKTALAVGFLPQTFFFLNTESNPVLCVADFSSNERGATE